MHRKLLLFALALAAHVTAPTGTHAQAARPAGAVWPDEGPRTWAPRPTEGAITADDLRTRLYQIADDSMKGREAATQGGWMAAEYIAAEFRRLGLQPAGENGTFFQEVPYGPLSYDSLGVQLAAAGTALRPGTDWVPMLPSGAGGIRAEFAGQNVGTVFGGRWGDTATALDASVVRGRVVVFLSAPPAPVAGGAQAPPMRDLRAQAAGAVGVLQVMDALPPNAVANAFTSRTALMPFTTSPSAGAIITGEAAGRLFDQPLSQLGVGAAGRALTGRWMYEYHRPEFPARNIIAILPGSDPMLRGQYVLLGAHNDHEGVVQGIPPDHDSLRAFNRVMRPQGANDRPGPPTVQQRRQIDALLAHARSIRPPRRDSVMNGADDDGSGTAVLMEIAERFATEAAPKRSIIFISHAAEEAGLLGSQYFTDHPTLPRDSIVAAHNMDMVGNGGVGDVKFGGPSQVQMLGARRLSSEFGDLIDSLNAVRSETMAIDYSWDRTNALNRFCRSDQVSYFRYAIPVTYFSTGYSIDYHQPTDEPQYIDYEHSARVGRFVHEIMATIAERPTRLRVLPMAERDMSARC